MKKIILTIPLLIALAMFCNGQNVKGKIGFSFKPQNDSVTIAVVCHAGDFSPNRISLYSLVKIKSGDFEFQLPPGTYVCRILHPELTITDIPLVIEDINSEVGFDIRLGRLRLPSEIQNVQLRIWPKSGKPKVISLTQNGNRWAIPQNSTLPKDIHSYLFWINNTQYFHRSAFQSQLYEDFLYYRNIFQGEDIFLSQDEYYKSKKNHVVFTSNGIDLEHIYQLYNNIEEVYERDYTGRTSLDSSGNAKYYLQASSMFEKIIEEEDSCFSQIVIEPYLFLIGDHHPANFKKGAFSGEDVDHLKQSELFQEMEAKKLDLLKLVDVETPILSGSFMYAFYNYWFDFKTPYNYIKHDLPFGFFLQLEYDFLQQTPSYFAKGNMLTREIQQLKRGNPDRALELINTLEEKYADHPRVKYGRLEKTKTDLLRNQGSAAPNFELVSLGGDTLRLIDYKGKYVFLDFWGSWCAPCMSELPNIKELSETISHDRLMVIGIVCHDSKERIEKVIQDQNLKYINAMATDEIIDDFGISKYPTTYLVDPNGTIVGKDLRGDNLASRIGNILKN